MKDLFTAILFGTKLNMVRNQEVTNFHNKYFPALDSLINFDDDIYQLLIIQY